MIRRLDRSLSAREKLLHTLPVGPVLQIARLAYQETPPIQRWVRRVTNTWFRGRAGPERILLVGIGGGGKTTLHHYLCGRPQLTSPNYRQTNVIDSGSYGGGVFGKITTFPGQDNPFADQSPSPSSRELVRLYQDATGLIFLGSYGFNNPPPGSQSPGSAADLLKLNLEREDSLIEAFLDALPRFRKLAWMLIGVNKRDIWVPNEVACAQRYEAIRDKIVARLQTIGKGGQTSVSLAYFSLMSTNVIASDGQMIFQISPTYDDAVREKDFRDFAMRVDELAGSNR